MLSSTGEAPTRESNFEVRSEMNLVGRENLRVKETHSDSSKLYSKPDPAQEHTSHQRSSQ